MSRKSHRAFDVFEPTVTGHGPLFMTGLKHIDTVFYGAGAKVDAEEVRRSLINHDGYPGNIVVREA